MSAKIKVLNFGSLNIDHVYTVKSFVRPGETISAVKYERFPGGKGLNQSIALARAGISVCHAGRIGDDGIFLKTLLEDNHVDCSAVKVVPGEASGHAMIQVDAKGENCIVLFGGSNRRISEAQIESAISAMQRGDFLLIQNEISSMPEIMKCAYDAGLRIFFNPAPMTEDVLSYPLDKVETLIVNETEGASVAGMSSANYKAIISVLRNRFPKVNLLMTLGALGAVYCASGTLETVFVPACHVDHAVDTTAAGDTFIGYFLSGIAQGKSPESCMQIAAKASAICVSRMGAGVSIPRLEELSL